MNNILPNVQCPTCSEPIEGRRISLESVQVYSRTLQKLIGLRDTSNGSLDHLSDRVDVLGHGLVSNPSVLRYHHPDPLVCALCLCQVWPAEGKVVHIDPQCLALFHDKCLGLEGLDFRNDENRWKESAAEVGISEPGRCPSCWRGILAETEEQTEVKIVIDEQILHGERPPRPAVRLDVALMSARSIRAREAAHPRYHDLQPSTGRPKDRPTECIICKENKAEEPTWIHRAGHCLNSCHQTCLQPWIDIPRDQEGKESWEVGPTCPACRALLKARPEAPGKDSIEFESPDVITEFEALPENVQEEVKEREEEGYDGWPIVVWTDRLRPAICSEGKCCM